MRRDNQFVRDPPPDSHPRVVPDGDDHRPVTVSLDHTQCGAHRQAQIGQPLAQAVAAANLNQPHLLLRCSHAQRKRRARFGGDGHGGDFSFVVSDQFAIADESQLRIVLNYEVYEKWV